jgi:hypothetical protein
VSWTRTATTSKGKAVRIFLARMHERAQQWHGEQGPWVISMFDTRTYSAQEGKICETTMK